MPQQPTENDSACEAAARARLDVRMRSSRRPRGSGTGAIAHAASRPQRPRHSPRPHPKPMECPRSYRRDGVLQVMSALQPCFLLSGKANLHPHANAPVKRDHGLVRLADGPPLGRRTVEAPRYLRERVPLLHDVRLGTICRLLLLPFLAPEGVEGPTALAFLALDGRRG